MFRKKERDYLEEKINELAANSKNKNVRVLFTNINQLKDSYQHKTSIVKDENGNLLADILNRWKNYL
jgi:hypothetical protein